MTTLTIEAEDELLVALEQIAQLQRTTVESVIKDTLRQRLQSFPTTSNSTAPVDQATSSNRYSFLGIWHSGKRNLSTQVEEVLAEEMGRDRHWS